MRRLARLVVATSALAGCSTGYTPPPPSAAASLQFVNKTALPMAVHLYDDAAQCKGRHALEPVLKPQEERVVLVPSGRVVAFSITYDIRLDYIPIERIATGCIVTLSFKPELRASYVFRMDSDGLHCVYQLSDATQAKEGRTAPAAFIKREAVRATSESGPFCR